MDKVIICDALRDLVPFAQFKKREKHPQRSVTFSKVAGLTSHLHNTRNSEVIATYKSRTEIFKPSFFP